MRRHQPQRPRQRPVNRGGFDFDRQPPLHHNLNRPPNPHGRHNGNRPNRPPGVFMEDDPVEPVEILLDEYDNLNMNGPAFDEPPLNDRPLNGPPFNDRPLNGAPFNGPPFNGRPEPNANPAVHPPGIPVVNPGVDPVDVPNGNLAFAHGHGEHPRPGFANGNGQEPGPGPRQHHQNEADRLRTELEESRTKSTQNRQLIFNLSVQLALKCEETKNYKDARQHYREAFKLKALEETALREDGHELQAREVEAEELLYKFKYARMLNEIGKHHEAATALEDVFTRRKHSDPSLQNAPTREALLEFCKVLRLGGSQEGLERARVLYRAHGDLDCRDSPENSDHSWRLRNAFNVVYVLVEQQFFDNAVNELSSVWRKGKDSIAAIEAEIGELLKSFRQRDAEAYAMQALQIVCQGNRAITSPLVRVVSAEGLRLYNSGRYAEAIGLLQRALKNTSPAATQERLKISWPLALSYCQTKNPKAAAPILEGILLHSNAQTEPSEYCLRALLAYVLLASNQLAQAKQNAQFVWDKHKTQKILPFHGYHHADTLICAIAKEKYEENKWKKVKGIWDQLYTDAKKLCSDRQAKDQVLQHIATGDTFADQWESCMKARPKPKLKPGEVWKSPSTAEKNLATVRGQIKDLKDALPK